MIVEWFVGDFVVPFVVPLGQVMVANIFSFIDIENMIHLSFFFFISLMNIRFDHLFILNVEH